MNSENLVTERTSGYSYNERKDEKLTFQKASIEKKTSSFLSFVSGFITLLSVGLISWGILASFQWILSWNIYLGLGIADFQPGFLITVNHTDWIKANATIEANSASAGIMIEESYNFLYFRFEQNGIINNITELIYDRFTGL